MLFDTDIFIWIQRGNRRAAQLVENEEERLLSLQTYLELLQGVQNKQQHDQGFFEGLWLSDPSLD